jgi:uncharacterized protein
MADQSPLEITDNRADQRFEARLGERLVGWGNYLIAGDTIIFTHTRVPAEFEGRGVASRLVRHELEDVRSRGLRVTPRCPFVAAYIRRHPEYADLVADDPNGGAA